MITIFKNWIHVHSFLAVGAKTTTVVDSIQFESDYRALGKVLEVIIFLKLPATRFALLYEKGRFTARTSGEDGMTRC